MNPDFLLVLPALFLVAWIMLFVQSHRLFYKFRSKYPEVARKEIPNAFRALQHREKFFYFLREKSEIALRDDPPLLALRRQVKILAMVSFIVLPGCFLIVWLAIAGYILMGKFR